MKKNTLSKRYIFVLLTLCLLLALSLIFHPTVWVDFSQALALTFWAVWRIILSINEEIYWSGLIILGLLMALRLVPVGKHSVRRYQYAEQPKAPSEVDLWFTLLSSAPYQARDAQEMNRHLSRLIDSRAKLKDENENEITRLGKEKLPPEPALFLIPWRRNPWRIVQHWAYQRLPEPLKKSIWGERPADVYYDALEEVLKLIETDLEYQDDEFRNK